MLQAHYPHDAHELQLLETHISWVILTGPWAYKLKKPVRFDFLDYSTMELRLHFCHRELEANQVWAVEIYQDVVPIFGHGDSLRVGRSGDSPVDGESLLDHAVRMRQFPQSALLSEQLKLGLISTDMMEQLASDLAALHGRIEAVDDRPDLVHVSSIAPALENFQYLCDNLSRDDPDRARIKRLEDWTQREIHARTPRMQFRAQQRCVRNCHGDLHLDNLLYLQGRFIPFDGIEFNDALRQIDVLSEIAFLAMELSEQGYPQHARRLVNRYVEAREDYEGLALLRYYLVYRAMVRTKVDLIRQRQTSTAGATGATAGLSSVGRQYLAYAQSVVEPIVPQLWITYGLSGSGKSATSKVLVQQQGFFRLRSDVIRKRLAGRDPFEKPPPALLPSLYSAEMTQRTYQRLQELARGVLAAGFHVVIDATFLKRDQRQAFRDLAQQCDVPFRILYCHGPPDELERRILARRDDPSDACVAILHSQLRSAQPPSGDELSSVVQQQEVWE